MARLVARSLLDLTDASEGESEPDLKRREVRIVKSPRLERAQDGFQNHTRSNASGSHERPNERLGFAPSTAPIEAGRAVPTNRRRAQPHTDRDVADTVDRLCCPAAELEPWLTLNEGSAPL
jgi:hypothetical protein